MGTEGPGSGGQTGGGFPFKSQDNHVEEYEQGALPSQRCPGFEGAVEGEHLAAEVRHMSLLCPWALMRQIFPAAFVT